MRISDLSRKPHGTYCGSRCLQHIVRIGGDKCGHHSRKLASCSRDLSHLRLSVPDHEAAFAVRHKIDRAGHRDHRSGACGIAFHEADHTVQVLFGNGIRGIRIHAFGRSGAYAEGFDLRDVPADHCKMNFAKKVRRRTGPKAAGTCSYRIQQNGVVQFLRLFSRKMHAPDTALIQGADIDIQSSADGSDILDVLRLIRHDRASPARKDHVRHVIDSHVIGDIVYQRSLLPHSIKIFSKHLFFLLFLPGIPDN